MKDNFFLIIDTVTFPYRTLSSHETTVGDEELEVGSSSSSDDELLLSNDGKKARIV